MESEDFKLIVNAIESGKCLAFLGAGACTSFKNRNGEEFPGLPTGRELAEKLAAKCKYSNGNAYDLLKVAEYFLYFSSGDREQLESTVREEIQNKRCIPRPIHTVLAQLNQVKIIITSNYDKLMEQELQNYNPFYTLHFYNRNDSKTGHFHHSPEIEPGEIILYKMHGTVDIPLSMVITESDYIYYLTHMYDVDRGVPDFFWKTWIPHKTLLFLGYSLEDMNFKVLWEGMLSKYRLLNPSKISYALVKDPKKDYKEYWRDRNIRIIDMDLTEFAVQLASRFELKVPQME